MLEYSIKLYIYIEVRSRTSAMFVTPSQKQTYQRLSICEAIPESASRRQLDGGRRIILYDTSKQVADLEPVRNKVLNNQNIRKVCHAFSGRYQRLWVCQAISESALTSTAERRQIYIFFMTHVNKGGRSRAY